MNNREKLADRRESAPFEFRHDNHRYHGRYSCYPDGRLAEVFLDSNKTGTLLSITMKDAAIVASLALQHGCSLETIRHAMLRDDEGKAAGPLGAALDLISYEKPLQILPKGVMPYGGITALLDPPWYRRLWNWILRLTPNNRIKVYKVEKT